MKIRLINTLYGIRCMNRTYTFISFVNTPLILQYERLYLFYKAIEVLLLSFLDIKIHIFQNMVLVPLQLYWLSYLLLRNGLYANLLIVQDGLSTQFILIENRHDSILLNIFGYIETGIFLRWTILSHL